ncbi:MAG: hypothetical protein ACFCVK_11945 [Acidimicrobiales bacterium]
MTGDPGTIRSGADTGRAGAPAPSTPTSANDDEIIDDEIDMVMPGPPLTATSQDRDALPTPMVRCAQLTPSRRTT